MCAYDQYTPQPHPHLKHPHSIHLNHPLPPSSAAVSCCHDGPGVWVSLHVHNRFEIGYWVDWHAPGWVYEGYVYTYTCTYTSTTHTLSAPAGGGIGAHCCVLHTSLCKPLCAMSLCVRSLCVTYTSPSSILEWARCPAATPCPLRR